MSADGLTVALQDGILVLTLARPPVNALTPDLRLAVLTALRERDDGCRGVVLAAEGPAFSNGVMFDTAAGEPTLAELCLAVAECPVPVVAALHGAVSGPGAELALAARARLAAATLRIAFPEVLLGLCPEGGSTQRLPGLIGARAALKLLLTGRPIPASEALSLGLIDGVTETAPLGAAIRLARALAGGEPLVRARPDVAEWQVAVATMRRDPSTRLPASQRIVDCVEAALLLPPENGLAFEAVARRDLAETPEAAGLQAAARAERRALTMPTVLARLRPPSIDRIGLSGGGPELARLAIAALAREVPVSWAFPDRAAREAALVAVEEGLAQGQRGGGGPPGRWGPRLGQLTTVADPALLNAVPFLVHDRAPESREFSGGLPGAAHLVLGGGDGVMGLAIAPSGRVCELALTSDTLPLSQATAIAGLRRIGLFPLLVGQRPALGARLADAGKTALAWMAAQGVPLRLIVSALAVFGTRPPDALTAEVPTILRAMAAGEVVNRWLAAVANEGARLLDEGIALRASDIDHLMVGGFSFPRWQGGPMHQADRRGLMVLRRDLRVWAADGPVWSPAPLIDRLIGDGKTFAALND